MDQIAKVREEINAVEQQLVATQAYIAAIKSKPSVARATSSENSSFGGIYIGTGDWILIH